MNTRDKVDTAGLVIWAIVFVVVIGMALVVRFADIESWNDRSQRYDQCILDNAHEVQEVKAYCQALRRARESDR